MKNGENNMYIEKRGLKEEEYQKLKRLVNESFAILQDILGIDRSENIYICITDELETCFAITVNLLGYRDMYIINNLKETPMSKIYKQYESMIQIDKKHLLFADENQIIDTIIHEILHHLTNDEEDEHGMQWTDLANYVFKCTSK